MISSFNLPLALECVLHFCFSFDVNMSTNATESEEYIETNFNEPGSWAPELQQYGLVRSGGWSSCHDP